MLGDSSKELFHSIIGQLLVVELRGEGIGRDVDEKGGEWSKEPLGAAHDGCEASRGGGRREHRDGGRVEGKGDRVGSEGVRVGGTRPGKKRGGGRSVRGA